MLAFFVCNGHHVNMTKTKFIIRPARHEDAAAIADVNMNTRRRCYAAFMPPEFIAANIVTPQRIANWQQRIAQKDFLYLGETENGKIVALAWGSPSHNPEIPIPFELHALYVLPDCQGCGLGRRLIEKFAEYAGYRPFYLYMLKNNPVAGFYRHMGGIRHPEYDIQKTWQSFILEEEDRKSVV